MFFIRRAKVDDVATLLKLAKMVHFINLPPDRDIITQKIIHSRNSFLGACGSDRAPEPEPTPKLVAGLGTGVDGGAPANKTEPTLNLTGLGQTSVASDLFLFVLEDTESGSVLGTSQILAEMGGPGNPNVSFRLEERRFFSKSLQTGTSHTVAELHLDETSPTEIGGLILQPSYRSHKKRLGRFLSLVRFHFLGLHRSLFSDRIIAEMMAPITADGASLLWDYLGRRFVPLSYEEADRFCQYSREFITSLLPRDEIYLSLLPPQARAVIGEVNAETAPARRMLEKLGFEYTGFVDPFDGGPHLEARTDSVGLLRLTERRQLGEPADEPADEGGLASPDARLVIASSLQSDGEFYAVCEPALLDGDGRVRFAAEAPDRLRAREGDEIGVTPVDGRGPLAGEGAA